MNPSSSLIFRKRIVNSGVARIRKPNFSSRALRTKERDVNSLFFFPLWVCVCTYIRVYIISVSKFALGKGSIFFLQRCLRDALISAKNGLM